MIDIARYKVPLIIAGSLIVLGTLVWVVYHFFLSFSIISVTPDAQRVSTLAPVITIETNKTISDKTIEFDDGGDAIVASVTHHDNLVIINLFASLAEGHEYTITLKNITSVQGLSIDTYTYVFTPEENSDWLSDTDQKILLNRQEQKPEITGDPVYGATPIVGEGFVITSVLSSSPDGKGTISLIATIYPTREDVEGGYDAAITNYKARIQDALNKIEGYAADKYPITYKVQDP